MIYFIGNVEKDICKIGYSARPYRRIETLQKGVDYKLTVFDIIPGDRKTERIIHTFNDDSRITGEWYTLSKIKSLDISKKVFSIKVGPLLLIKNASGYYHEPSLTSTINLFRIHSKKRPITFSMWKRTNKEYIDHIKELGVEPIIKGYASWVHPYIAIDMLRSDVMTKCIVYDYIPEIVGDLRIKLKQ